MLVAAWQGEDPGEALAMIDEMPAKKREKHAFASLIARYETLRV